MIGKKIIVTTEYPIHSKKKPTIQEAVFLGFGLMVDEYTDGNPSITGAIVKLADGSIYLEYLRYIKFKG